MERDLVMSTATAMTARNPGPGWGFSFLLWAERWWPRWFLQFMLKVGAGVGLAFMPVERAHSRAYLTVVLGRRPSWLEMGRHFTAFAESMMLTLRAGRGVAVQCTMEKENSAEFEALVRSDRPALFGTFHFGNSDLLGYLLGGRGRRVSMLRLRVGNSGDTRLLGERFRDSVTFLWVNDPANLLFELKAALEAGASLALKCDRLEFSAKAEPFRFLGASRLFPFTIYHLAVMFARPVVFCLAVPGGRPDELRVMASPVFTPDPVVGREANLAAARWHFQGVLEQLEILVRAQPFLWFNFLPLNPVAPLAAD